MPRYKLTIEYDGTPYRGWQKQDDAPTVQQALEESMQQFAQHSVSVFAAGRTDAGVHALGQVIHVDLEKEWQPGKIVEAANGILRLRSHPVCVLSAEQMDENFDARFSAIKRYYRYRIINRVSPLALEGERAWWVRFPLDIDAMHEAAQIFLGKHDFSTFRSTDCQAKSPVRTVDRFRVTCAEGENGIGAFGRVINFDVESRSFLHSQVRSMVGSLKMIGDGRWTADNLVQALEAKDRKACGVVAPACGLYLTRVAYDEADLSN